jgi:DNA repair protein RecN (Recombination protein N)
VLVTLSIHDLAIIEDTTLELSSGLNVLTGETGAGKSIIIEALSLVLGDRAEVDLVRRGKERAEVEATFQLAGDSPTLERLQALDLVDRDDPESLIVRRIVAPGKGRAYINGRTVTVSTLAEVTRGLVDVSSQHQHTQLLDPSTHLEILDRFGGLTVQRETYQAAWRRVEEVRRRLSELSRREVERQNRESFVRFQLSEIAEVDPKDGEEQDLEQERVKLSHGDRLMSGAHEVAGLIGVTAGHGSASERLSAAQRQLDKLKAYDAVLVPLGERLESARIELMDIAAEVKAYADGIDVDPRRLDDVQSRLDAMRRLKKKHGGTIEAVIEARKAFETELSGFESLEIDIKEAERDLSRKMAEVIELGRQLSAARSAASATLEERVAGELMSLAMGGAAIRFAFELAEMPGPEGFERGEIHIQTNRGEGFLPLHRSASGGELARVLLALKRALMHVDPVETCIFDEVDSGTGGAVGDMIGKKLEEIGAERQVLCITHLPQIAARGATHLKVMKTASGERTLTEVTRLTGEARVEEIARMLGGVEITKTTREHARELVGRTVSSDKKRRAAPRAVG